MDHPELREVFIPLNVRANKAKAWSQIAGSCAVLFALMALLGAASEPLFADVWEWRTWVVEFIAVLSLVGALTAVALAVFGVLAGPRKEEWLHTRLFTERLRQFHFQTFIWRLPDIAASCVDNNPQAQEEYRQKRQRWFSNFMMLYEGQLDSQLSGILDPGIAPDVWLHETSGHRPILPDGFDPDELFAAYRKLRFLEQYGYVSHKLRSIGHTLNFLKLPVRTQERLLRYTWAVAFGLLIVLHAAIVVSHFANNVEDAPKWLPFGVIWLALIALAVRTLAEGLSLEREIERYEDYRSVVRDMIGRFDNADDNHEKLDVMVEMERVAFDEMRSFLRSGHDATFVL